MKALVIAETEVAARELCAGARLHSDQVVLAMVGAPAVTGCADKCIHIDVPVGNVADDAYVTLCKVFDAEACQTVFGQASERMLSLIGRLAAHAGTAAITDITALENGQATSMYFGGIGIRTAKATGPVAVYTVGAGTFDASGATGSDVVEEAVFEAPAVAVVKKAVEALPVSDVDLCGADIVLGVGRGFTDEADLQPARDLASKIGAAMGCTRPLTEAVTWFPREAYIGVSGQMLAPKVYIACGISGQMQHMVGCNRADVVFAVNKDKNAPVFKQCDYGIVGDVKEVLPALVAAL